jgi:hypothetical protein
MPHGVSTARRRGGDDQVGEAAGDLGCRQQVIVIAFADRCVVEDDEPWAGGGFRWW